LRWSGRWFALDGRVDLDTPRATRVWTLGALWTVRVVWTLVLLSIPRGVKNLDDQVLFEIENLGIPRAIGLQFVGWLFQIKSDASCLKFELFLII